MAKLKPLAPKSENRYSLPALTLRGCFAKAKHPFEIKKIIRTKEVP